MKILSICFIILIFSACSEKKETEKLSRNCGLQLSIFSKYPQGVTFDAYFNISSNGNDTLYISKSTSETGKYCIFNGKIKLKSFQKDTLYNFFQNIKENFKLADNNTPDSDDNYVRIDIDNSHNSALYVYRSLGSARSENPEIDKLIHFINKRLPEKLKYIEKPTGNSGLAK
jgi:hypothetical protein